MAHNTNHCMWDGKINKPKVSRTEGRRQKKSIYVIFQSSNQRQLLSPTPSRGLLEPPDQKLHVPGHLWYFYSQGSCLQLTFLYIGGIHSFSSWWLQIQLFFPFFLFCFCLVHPCGNFIHVSSLTWSRKGCVACLQVWVHKHPSFYRSLLVTDMSWCPLLSGHSGLSLLLIQSARWWTSWNSILSLGPIWISGYRHSLVSDQCDSDRWTDEGELSLVVSYWDSALGTMKS